MFSLLSGRQPRLFWSLADSLQSGLNAIQALEALAAGGPAWFSAALRRLRDELKRGTSLSEAMRREPRLFESWQCEIISVGELTGRLDEACRSIAEILEESRSFLISLLSGLAYPVVLLHLAPVILLAPKAFTEGVACYARAVLAALAALYLPAGAAVLAYFGWLKDKGLAPRLPILGSLAKMRFCRYLSVMLKAGISLPKAMSMAAAASGWPQPGTGTQGEALVSRLRRLGFFSPEELAQLDVAELSGRVDAELSRIGERSRLRWQAALKAAGVLIPLGAGLLIMALAAYRIIAFYLGYFDSLNALDR